MHISQGLRRLPLEGVRNTRDLGGYPCAGGATRWGVFLRSDVPRQLTPGDIEYLKAYGLTSVVDLRRDDERQVHPSLLANSEGIEVRNLSVNESFNLDFEGDLPGSMAGLYISMLDRSAPAFVQVMQALADARGTALFHCAVGKDRTGVVAMFLLALAGVAEPDIVADYAVTDIYMRQIFDLQVRALQDEGVPDHVLRSIPASMERTLLHLNETYDGAERYLLDAGLAPQSIAAIREKFVCRQ